MGGFKGQRGLTPFYTEFTLFALRIALIEICFGLPIEKVRPEDGVGAAGSDTGDYANNSTVTRILKSDLLMEEASMRYKCMVRRCIHRVPDSRVRNHDLDDDNFRKLRMTRYVAIHLNDKLE